MRTVIISGLSGSGKSSVIKTLEDLGFYCVDNLPVPLLRRFLGLIGQSAEEITKIAVGIDARDKQHIGELPATLEELAQDGRTIELLFMEASDEVLARRFSETRHRHPLSPTGTPLEGIQKERKLLEPIRKLAKLTVDTSEFSSSDLRRHLLRSFGTASEPTPMAISISSFGFKHGLPTHVDLVFDVRFLTNPYFKEELKHKTGLEPDVIDYVVHQTDAAELLSELKRLFKFLIPRYEREGKSYLNVAIGCTGGRHRSVVVAAQLAKILETMGHTASVSHRDLERE